MYEVSPDFGMMAQEWNLSALAYPIVTQFFGIQPMAGEKTIKIDPLLPSDWDHIGISNVIIGDNKVNVQVKREGETIQVEVKQSNPEWKIEVPFERYATILVNGQKHTMGDKIEVTGEVVKMTNQE